MAASEALAQQLNAQLTPLPWQERLRALAAHPELHTAFSTSFSLEDQAITHSIATNALPFRIFTLDTGRLFEQVHDVHRKTRERYGLVIETYFPAREAVEAFVNTQGINGFYHNVENRLSCCHIRKVEPLNRALAGTDIWISGLRREHSAHRATLPVVEWDAGHRVIKCYPLVEMSEEEVRAFLYAYEVPYNPLYDQGYPSIGCAPCTRAVAAGEPARSGRWWWEQEGTQECGLHVKDGKLVAAKGKPTHA
ncbi:MAG: phosphoadenylyl-sulfate reductase [Alphaproteobacteria bacterium]|nr:phosphoadenylyl-sulfate reductase [Alphaproteobacteria bacterium]